MAILASTDITGTVVFLGLVRDREATIASGGVREIAARFEGVTGESHSGLVRASCSRVVAQYPRGTPIRNTRQVSIVSREELAEIAAAMDLPDIPPQWLGANIALAGLPQLTLIPPSSRLIFDGGAALTVDMENNPCQFPAREIDRRHPGRGAGFKRAALHRRGVTAWVEREGAIRLGDTARLHVPPQRPYPPLAGG